MKDESQKLTPEALAEIREEIRTSGRKQAVSGYRLLEHIDALNAEIAALREDRNSWKCQARAAWEKASANADKLAVARSAKPIGYAVLPPNQTAPFLDRVEAQNYVINGLLAGWQVVELMPVPERPTPVPGSDA